MLAIAATVTGLEALFGKAGAALGGHVAELTARALTGLALLGLAALRGRDRAPAGAPVVA